MPTRGEFLKEYERQLVARYAWAADPVRLARFMSSVRNTLAGGNVGWLVHSGEAVDAAWLVIGGHGLPSLKALRGLADDTVDGCGGNDL